MRFSTSVLLRSSACTLALLLPAQAATAQDSTQGTVDWSGNYVGLGADVANAGVAWSTDYGGAYGGELDTAPFLSFGRNWQNGNVVYGLEGVIVGPGYEGEAEVEEPTDYRGLYDWGWTGSIRGRVGVASGSLMTYAVGGLTVGELELIGCEGLPCFDQSYTIYAKETVVGMNLGFGAEYALSSKSSLRAEYLYTAFPSVFSEENENGRYTEPGDLSTDAHTLRFSWNYMLGEGRSTSVEAGLGAANRDWSGAYVGGFAIGGLIVDDALNPFYESNRAYNTAGAAGVAAGYNWQRGNVVYGAVVDVATGGLESDSYWADDYRKEQEWDWLATVRARAGIVTGDLYLYGTAGVAAADMAIGVCSTIVDENDPCDPADLDAIYEGTNVGLTAGFGAEFAMSERLSLFGEYSFVGFPNQRGDKVSDGSDGDIADHTTAAHFVKFGANYSFGQGRAMSGDPLHNWSGTYAGAIVEPRLQYLSTSGGYGGGTGSDLTTPAGLVVGHNWQRGNVVLGVEGDITAGADETRFEYYDGDYVNASEWNWTSTIRARAGIATGKALLYATGGVAVGDITGWACDGSDCVDPSDDDVTTEFDDTLFGITASIGAEYAFSDNVSGTMEYRYVGFPSEMGDEVGGSGFEADFTNYSQGVRIGVNYSF